jgi:orotidine-5'-phosphate decarboxylase
MTGSRAPIAVALDTSELGTATAWATAVAPSVRAVKVGLQLFCSEGPGSVEKVRTAADVDLFLDLKLNDIPATVAGAARSLRPLSPTYLTVHAMAGPAAVEAAATALPDTRIAGVTVLTSLSAADLDLLGIIGPPEAAVRRLARVAVGAGARALVCSPQEVATVRDEVGPDVVLITPGIRPAGSDAQDQSRISTPESALAAGADLLVIGRPITGADDVGRAAADLAAQMTS